MYIVSPFLVIQKHCGGWLPIGVSTHNVTMQSGMNLHGDYGDIVSEDLSGSFNYGKDNLWVKVAKADTGGDCFARGLDNGRGYEVVWGYGGEGELDLYLCDAGVLRARYHDDEDCEDFEVGQDDNHCYPYERRVFDPADCWEVSQGEGRQHQAIIHAPFGEDVDNLACRLSEQVKEDVSISAHARIRRWYRKGLIGADCPYLDHFYTGTTKEERYQWEHLAVHPSKMDSQYEKPE